MAFDVTMGWDDMKIALGSTNHIENEELEEGILWEKTVWDIKEHQKFEEKPEFGTVTEVYRQNIIQEVNNTPKDVFVIIHLYQDYIVHCRLIDECLSKLAMKFVNYKFMRIKATSCLENFRDSNCPALVVCKNSRIVHQMIGCACLLGGIHISEDSIEWVLAQKKVWETDLQENPADFGKKQCRLSGRKTTWPIDTQCREDIITSMSGRKYT
ncbi:hypothetical protein SteCoe_27464 [Stentor coeruleus]|uniref:Phosducin domain-containing protein n=1 Tax=Stentor coeruleus TaxID=5963 RepID=A0A1R2BAI3_9CILI|nr:hypothetical protein SteCoe_27464 [Stentor coeruleus]